MLNQKNPIIFVKIVKPMFTKIISKFQFQPEVELLALRFNAQLPVFVSYHPDPEAIHINAFSISWRNRPFYAFPPFARFHKIAKASFESCKEQPTPSSHHADTASLR